jgi:hypothetical protein
MPGRRRFPRHGAGGAGTLLAALLAAAAAY